MQIVAIGEDGRPIEFKPGMAVGGAMTIGQDMQVELECRIILDTNNQAYKDFYHELKALLKKYQGTHVVKYVSNL